MTENEKQYHIIDQNNRLIISAADAFRSTVLLRTGYRIR